MRTFADLVAEGTIYYSDGYRTKQIEIAEDGYRILRVADVHHGWISLDGTDHIDAAYEMQIGKKAARDGDLLLTTKGTIGRVAMVSGLGDQKVAYSPQLCFFRVMRGDTLDAHFLRYWFSSPDAQRQIRNFSGNTDMAPYLNLRDIGALSISLPKMPTQRAIAEVLGALDDKIVANRLTVQSADTLRAALWKRLADSASQVPLSSIARFVNGKAFTKDATGTGKVVIRIAELNSGVGTSTVYNDLDVAEDHLARPGDLLMAWSGSLTAARWYRDEAIVNQHIFKVIPSLTNPVWGVACAVETKMLEFKMIAATKATTMGHIQRRDLDEPVHWPELSDTDRDLGGNLWTRALLAERESERLVATRDELLPLLMSGKITVKDGEKRVEREI